MRQNKRDELVRKALDAFYKNGFTATGMDMLVKETGVSKTSMYKHFRTKDELILAVLRLRDERFRDWLYRRMDELGGDTPRGKLIALFDALREWFGETYFQGCMFIKASAEFQKEDCPINMQSAEHKRILLDYFTTLCSAAGAQNPRDLAYQLLILKEGAIILAAMKHTTEPALHAKLAAQILLSAALDGKDASDLRTTAAE
jgi:AcrR family transcriptional regulator